METPRSRATSVTALRAFEDVEDALASEFYLRKREGALTDMIDNLPAEVFEMGEKLPVEVRKQFVSAMEPWAVQSEIRYNPRLRFSA